MPPDGGETMPMTQRRYIPYGRQDIDDHDRAAVDRILRADFITQGPAIDAFEADLAGLCESRYSVAVSSGTAALHLAYLALGVGPGDTVWTTPNSFVATANAALLCGAKVDFVDIDPDTRCMSPQALERKLAASSATALPKAVVPVHFGGHCCDMPAIAGLAAAYGFRVVEDGAHSLGAAYRDADGARHMFGSCAHADLAIASFHPVKIITTGEGGAVMTGDAELDRRLRLLRSHGVTRDAGLMENPSEGDWYYEQVALGLNYRITDLQCALGSSQLARLPGFLERRRHLAARYDELLSGLPVRRPTVMPGHEPAWHLYAIEVDADRRRSAFDAMRAAGIGVNVHYIPIHLQPHYRRLQFAPGQFPVAERYYRGALSLPLFPGLETDEQDHVVSVLAEALS